jgi:hypothetical protein
VLSRSGTAGDIRAAPRESRTYTDDAELAFASRVRRLPFGRAWESAPDLAARGRVDAFDARDRLAIYRLLIDRTGSRAVVGAHGERHIFWGYASQLHWQWESGRLGPGADIDRISPAAWWGCMNYTLCIVPLVAAIEVGVVPRLEVAGGTRPSPVPRDLDEPLSLWRTFFGTLNTLTAERSLGRALVQSWAAHLASIRAGVRLFVHEFKALDPLEQRFAAGWTRVVELLAGVVAPTELSAVAAWDRAMLPPRLLRTGDHPGRILDMSDSVNDTVRRIIDLSARPRWQPTWDLQLWAWRMRAAAARRRSELGPMQALARSLAARHAAPMGRETE